jgi:hypothetical protein
MLMKLDECHGIHIRSNSALRNKIDVFHGYNDDSDSELVCNLLVADIVDSKFGGLGVHAPGDKVDFVTKYDAFFTSGEMQKP